MNSYPKLFYILKEINLFDKTNLVDELNSLLKQKNVTKPEIIDYFKKPYLKWFVSPTDDQEKQHYVKKHHVSSGDPEWAKNTFDFNHLSTEHKEELAHTIDFFNQLNERDLKKIHKIPFPIVRELVKKWDEDLARRMDSSIHHFKIGKDVEILKQWPNGYKIVKILNDEARKEEGDIMGHCVGGEHYADETILSLRDEHGMPHVTMEVNPNDEIQQIKGKQNAAPVNKYVPYIKEFINESDLEVDTEDANNIGFIPWGGEWYDPTGNKWEDVYKNSIIPEQHKILNNIYNNIRDGKIDGLYLGGALLKQLPPRLKNVTVTGTIYLQHNLLENLENFPLTTRETSVYLPYNKLKSLEGISESLGSLDISNNPLENLKGGPRRVNRNLSIKHNKQLRTLEGFPEDPGDFIMIRDCPELKTLRGMSKTISGDMRCVMGTLESLEGGPEIVNGSFYIYVNKLKSLKGCPRVVRNDFDCEFNILTKKDILENFPEEIGGYIYMKEQYIDNSRKDSHLINITKEELEQRFPRLNFNQIK